MATRIYVSLVEIGVLCSDGILYLVSIDSNFWTESTVSIGVFMFLLILI